MKTRDLHCIAREALARLSTSAFCEWTRAEYLAIGYHTLWLEHELVDEQQRREFAERLLRKQATEV